MRTNSLRGRNKTHNRNIYVPPDEYAAWEAAALRVSVERGKRVTVSGLIREAMAQLPKIWGGE